MEPASRQVATVWRRLARVARLRLHASSGAGGGGAWSGEGRGCVVVTRPERGVLCWEEHGRWGQAGGPSLAFQNAYRWQRLAGGFRLARRRQGRPAPLLELVPDGPARFAACAPHRCGSDVYTAVLQVREAALELRWRIKGPAKDTVLHVAYLAPSAG